MSKYLKQLKALEKLTPVPPRLAAEGWKKDWHMLISIQLSARTRDEVTLVISKKLFSAFKSPKALGNASLSQIQKIIKPVNFYKNKSKSVKACCQKLVKDFKSKVPHNLDQLITLPGVGRKTANVFLSEKGQAAIGIDTHVDYISHFLGWTKGKTQKQVEEDLERIFPKSKWKIVNRTLVRFGKTYRSKKKKDELLRKIKLLS